MNYTESGSDSSGQSGSRDEATGSGGEISRNRGNKFSFPVP